MSTRVTPGYLDSNNVFHPFDVDNPQPIALDSDQRLVSAAPRHRASGKLTTATAIVPIPADTKAVIVYASILARVGAGSSATPAASVQEQQTITAGDATSGNFTLGFQGQTSGNLTFDESAADIVTGLVALSSIGAAGVTASGGALGTAPVVVTFAAGILDGDQPLLVATSVDLAGGASASSMLPTIAQTRAAVTTTAYVEAGGVLRFAVAETDSYVYIAAESGTGIYRVGFFG